MPTEPGLEFSMAVLCYRSGADLLPFTERIHRAMSLFRFEWELILVANYWPGTGDITPDVARDAATHLPRVRVLAEPKQGAMGWDVRRGLDACTGRYIGFIDGDGQYPMEAIFSCFARAHADDLDFVKTYRVFRYDGLYRRLVSLLYNRLFVALFPAYRGRFDVNSKPKIFKRSAYERMRLVSDDWFIDAEMMLEVLRLGLRMHEIPIRFSSLSGRQSFVRPGALVEFTRNLFAYRFHRGRFAGHT